MDDGQAVVPGGRFDDDAVRVLQSGFGGVLVSPEDDGYQAACELWNGMIIKQPALIAQCTGPEDVARSIQFAREHGLPLAVRGGGHNAAGKALVDDGLVIDLSTMRAIRVDPENRIAYAQGGATWAEFDQATHEYGLATTGGQISSTGIAGLTLGGGFGWLMRSYGMACDNLIGAEVVTASGDVVRASESENADLLWGLRGGGGNFGVVTELQYRLHPVDTVFGGMIVHPADRAREALRYYRDFNQSSPDELTVYSALLTSPEGDRIIAFVVCYNGDPEEGRELIKPLLEWGPPVVTDVGPMPYPQMQQLLDEGFPPGLQVYWRGDFIQSLSDDVIDTLVEKFGAVTSPLSALVIEQFGGASRRVSPDSSAFVHRDADYNLAIISRWPEPTEAEPHIAWARDVHAAILPYSTGAYVNYLGEEGEDRIRAAYRPDVYDRLARLKARYDPENLFRLNQNIQPAS